MSTAISAAGAAIVSTGAARPGYTKPQLMWPEQWLPNPRPTDVGQLRPVFKSRLEHLPRFFDALYVGVVACATV
jgi:hypothetical protein